MSEIMQLFVVVDKAIPWEGSRDHFPNIGIIHRFESWGSSPEQVFEES